MKKPSVNEILTLATYVTNIVFRENFVCVLKSIEDQLGFWKDCSALSFKLSNHNLLEFEFGCVTWKRSFQRGLLIAELFSWKGGSEGSWNP